MKCIKFFTYISTRLVSDIRLKWNHGHVVKISQSNTIPGKNCIVFHAATGWSDFSSDTITSVSSNVLKKKLVWSVSNNEYKSFKDFHFLLYIVQLPNFTLILVGSAKKCCSLPGNNFEILQRLGSKPSWKLAEGVGGNVSHGKVPLKLGLAMQNRLFYSSFNN